MKTLGKPTDEENKPSSLKTDLNETIDYEDILQKQVTLKSNNLKVLSSKLIEDATKRKNESLLTDAKRKDNDIRDEKSESEFRTELIKINQRIEKLKSESLSIFDSSTNEDTISANNNDSDFLLDI